jgi:predicted  nucleic acid-binding Zn-ribbon protein
MSIDELPEQFEAFTERARAALDREIDKARATLQKIQGEIADASKALADLHHQRKLAESELATVKNDLQRASGLVGCGHDRN